MNDIITKLKNFDAYPKTLEDFRVRTFSGAAVSIISGLIIAWLFISELSLYLAVDVSPQLYVDVSRGEKLQINLDITFPKLACSYLSVDAMDVSGEHQLDVDHNIYKRRLTETGKPLSVAKEDLATKTSVIVRPDDYCGSCYGAGSTPNQCCNTCDEVREAYRKKGWAFSNADAIEQCKQEGFTEALEAQKGEGCQVYGHLLVNKVAGNFHFAPGLSFQSQNMHVHDLQPFKTMSNFNVSHHINRISFGKDFPGIINPLDGVSKSLAEGSGMYQYFVKIVPTIYESLDGSTINTNQFSVTEHFRPFENANAGLPGVFIMYDLSPIMVKFTETQKSFAHFLTGVCAIIGGVFTVAGIIDSLIYNSMRSLSKKIELGKAH
ncbi:Endoplasmic reticulum-Golgi intermediate compartment protein 3 [Balamuthia mandrillaris]